MVSASTSWSSPAGDFCGQPSPCGVDIWRARLDLDPAAIEALSGILSKEEQNRAARFRFSLHRGRFIASHGILRKILGCYLGHAPGAIHYSADAHGKPHLSALCRVIDRGDLRFNLSHSRDMALYAVAVNRDIGIDVEHAGRSCQALKMAARFFSPDEAAALGNLPERLREKAFFACWTRKEAYLKARGSGLSAPLDQFSVTVHPEEPPALLHAAWNDRAHLKWTLFDVDPGGGFMAAVAVEGRVATVRHFDAPVE